MNSSAVIQHLFKILPRVADRHAPTDDLYLFMKEAVRGAVEELFRGTEPGPRPFGPFGDLVLPYVNMGATDSLNLFDLDELILFSFYWSNRNLYRRVVDIGANIGLHTILLSKCGCHVRCYEPDPTHFGLLRRNLELNGCAGVEAFNAAVSSRSGETEFVRVLGNTMSSHLAGSKAHPYGDLERFPVKVEAFKPLIEWADLLKIDAEGHEREILLAAEREDWSRADALVEVGTPENAAALFEHFARLDVRMFAQKGNWKRVRTLEDMPAGYRDGTLFVTARDAMPWA